MATVKLIPGQTAATSDTISVASGETKVISIYTDQPNSVIPYGVNLELQRQNPAGYWNDVYAPELGHVQFNATLMHLVVSAVGDYRVVRLDISDKGVNVGVAED